MLFISIVKNYFVWHYTRAFMEIFHVWLNLMWFVVHLFSIPQLLKTWFSPWKRMVEVRGNRWNFEDLAGYVVVGLLSRVVGFLVRTVIIVAGLISLTFVVITGFATYTFWLVAPILIIILFGSGVLLLIS